MNRALYLHLPYCQKRCPYCHFDISTRQQGRDRVAHLLVKEFQQKNLRGPYTTVFLGGGTPLAADLRPLADGLGPLFQKAQEVTLEMNPENLPILLQQPDLLPSLGVTRVSLGVQSFDATRLFQLGRGHNPRLALQALEHLLGLGLTVSLDLLLCPFEGEAEVVEHNLRTLKDFPVQHISWYGLENPGHAHWAGRHESPEGHQALVPLYHHLRQALQDRGYHHYEISNFALPGKECLHNLGYWMGSPYDALGPSAAAFDGQQRSVTISGVEAWAACVEQGHPVVASCERLSAQRALREAAVLRLRTSWGIDRDWLFAQPDHQSLLLDLEGLSNEGGLEKTSEGWRLPHSLWPQADDLLCHLVG